MPTTILPASFIVLLLAFRESFTTPSFGNFACLAAGWVRCPGRHTITNVALASGAVGQRHLSVFHRFFARALWSLDALGQVLFRLALRWIPAGQPLVLLWAAAECQQPGSALAWGDRPWYRRKHALSFQDLLTARRRAGWRQALSTAPLAPRRLPNSLTAWPDAVLATA